jgi:hypothetical protein
MVQQHGIAKPIDIRSEHKRNGQMFRGHPNFRKKGMWNDWAIFDWGPHNGGHLLGEIWCFVDFSDLPADCHFQYGDSYVQRGVYAVIESSYYEDEQDDYEEPDIANGERKSDLFRAIRKERNGGAPMYYLADVEAIVATACVIPDIGSDCPVRYFRVTPRAEWSDYFIKWIKEVHLHEVEEMESDEE